MENVDNLIIEHLRGLRSEVAGMRTEVQSEFKDVKARLSHLDASMAGFKLPIKVLGWVTQKR